MIAKHEWHVQKETRDSGGTPPIANYLEKKIYSTFCTKLVKQKPQQLGICWGFHKILYTQFKLLSNFMPLTSIN